MKKILILFLSITMLFTMVSCATTSQTTSKYDDIEYVKKFVDRHSSKDLPEFFKEHIVYILNDLPLEYKKMIISRTALRFTASEELIDGTALAQTWCKRKDNVFSSEISFWINSDKNYMLDETIYHEFCHLIVDYQYYAKFHVLDHRPSHIVEWQDMLTTLYLSCDNLSKDSYFDEVVKWDVSVYVGH